MDLKKYQEALDNISEDIVSKYFNNNYSEYNIGKSNLIEMILEKKHEYLFDSLPFFIPYFRKHFLYFCKNVPDFVGMTLYSNYKESFTTMLSSLKPISKWYNLTGSKKKIVDAENSYRVIREKLFKVLESSKILKNDINEILKLIEPISELLYHRNARISYYILFSELKYSLQLINHIEDLNMMIAPHNNLEEYYSELLDELSGLTKLEYSKYTFINTLIEDLNIIYNRLEELHPIPIQQDQVSDSGSVTTKPTNTDKAVDLLGHIEGLSWDEITITLISLDSIRITTRDFKQTYHFSELDMKDKRSSEESDGNWKLLSLFALKNGTVTFKEIDDTRNYSEPKKAISLLQKKLKQVIGLQDNPIENYKSRVGYKAKFYIKSDLQKQYHGSTQQNDAIEELKW